jgi:thiol-disulfide isomerase/thioredoxin
MLLAIAACSPNAPDQAGSQGRGIDPANNIGDIKTVDVEGAPFARGDFSQSRLVMLNIWTTWCPPCLREMPDLAAISNERAGTGFRVVGIVADAVTELGKTNEETVALARSIMQELGVEYTVILPDETLLTGVLKDMYAVPTTVFVDGYGNLVGDSYVGSRSKDDWNKLIDELMETGKP